MKVLIQSFFFGSIDIITPTQENNLCFAYIQWLKIKRFRCGIEEGNVNITLCDLFVRENDDFANT